MSWDVELVSTLMKKSFISFQIAFFFNFSLIFGCIIGTCFNPQKSFKISSSVTYYRSLSKNITTEAFECNNSFIQRPLYSLSTLLFSSSFQYWGHLYYGYLMSLTLNMVSAACLTPRCLIHAVAGCVASDHDKRFSPSRKLLLPTVSCGRMC